MFELPFDLPCPTDAVSPVKQPSIFFGSFEFTEPIMVFTDLIVAAICFYAFYKLRVYDSSKVKFYFRTYFIGMGIATVLGGVLGHGMMMYVPFEFKLPGWLLSMVSIAVLERACIEVARVHIRKRIGIFFSWLNIIELITFMTISFGTLCFFYVEVHSAYGLLIIVFSFSLFVYLRTRNEGSRLMMIGVGAGTIAATVYTLEVIISPWFTHIDLGHIFMSVATIYFYLGGRKLLEIQSETA